MVDNDPAGSAAEIVNRWGAHIAHEVHFDIEPQRGIAYARNRSVRRAGSVDWIAFIDDDEVPPPGWLRSLVATQRRFGADGVSGTVVYRLAPRGRPWLASGPSRIWSGG